MDDSYVFADYTIRRTLADQIVFLQTHSSQYYVASGVGMVICEQIDKGESLEKIVSDICLNFDTDPDTARKDAKVFLQSLESAGIIIKSKE